MRNVLMVAVLSAVSACTLYDGGDDAAPAEPDTSIPVQDATPTACTVVEAEACPPWWTSCQPLRLRQAECRVMCEGNGTCAGYTVAECFTDCVEHRYEAFCLMP